MYLKQCGPGLALQGHTNPTIYDRHPGQVTTRREATMRKLRINGRRGAFQLLFAGVYLIVGVSFIFTPAAGTRQVSLRWLTNFVPLEPFAALWLISAAIAVYSAFRCRPADWVGFAALVFAPAMWGALFLIGAVTGTPAAYTSAAVYWLFAATPMIVSGMQGAHDRDRRKRIT